ncbi:MAG: dTMP kinase [Planctomycetia bacterium]|nr:dTMP kinase [Planctomycetia bacterium]
MAVDPTDTPSPGPARGFFLVLDGPDGGGKTTQAADLAARLRAWGVEVVTCRDPGGTGLGERLRAVLLDRDTVSLTLRAEMLLYMASRAQLVEEVIRPALARGAFVVSDRYLLANIVYQGDAGGLNVDEIALVGRAATGGLFPDLTLVLDVPPGVARSRIGPARDRIEDRPADYHARVREGFLRAAAGARSGRCDDYPAPVVVVDASGDRDEVAGRIRSEVERALALDPRG